MGVVRPFMFIGIVLFLFGVVIVAYGTTFLLAQWELETNGIKVKGTVFEIEKKSIYRSPWVRFRTLEGKEVVFLSKLEVNVDLFNYTVGQEVDVIYNKNDPKQAKIHAFWERHFEQLFLGAFGAFLMLLGFLMFFFSRRKANRERVARRF